MPALSAPKSEKAQLNLLLANFNAVDSMTIKSQAQVIHNLVICGEVANPTKLFEHLHKQKVDILMMDASAHPEGCFNLIEKIENTFPDCLVLVAASGESPDLIKQAMRAGAREFLTCPLSPNEVLAALCRFEILLRTKKNGSASLSKVIAVHGSKGGVGTTTITVNEAIACGELFKAPVALVDLDFNRGAIPLFLNIEPRITLDELVRNLDNVREGAFQEIMPKYNDSLWVMPGPRQLENSEAVRSEHLRQLVGSMKEAFQYILVDTGQHLDDRMVGVLDVADKILLVTTLELVAVYNARRALEIFQRLGYGPEKVKLVVNRHAPSHSGMNGEFEKALNYPIFGRIPNENYAKALEAIHRGRPLIQSNAKGRCAVSLVELARTFQPPGKLEEKKKPEKSNDRWRIFAARWQKTAKV